MPINDDGDAVRGLGFVALYCAYLEEAVDEVVVALTAFGSEFPEDIQRLPVSEKIERCRRIIEPLIDDNEEMNNLNRALNYSNQLFDHRNQVIHGRIYGQHDGPDRLRSGRIDVSERPIDSAELYQLANDANNAVSALAHGYMFTIARALR